jgi:hypothetical protein
VSVSSEISNYKLDIMGLLRKIFGPKRDEVTGRRRKLHNEDLRDLCSSQIKIRMIKLRRMLWARHVVRMEQTGNACSLLVIKPEEIKPLERQRRKWAYGNKMYLIEISWGGVHWTDLAQDRDKW